MKKFLKYAVVLVFVSLGVYIAFRMGSTAISRANFIEKFEAQLEEGIQEGEVYVETTKLDDGQLVHWTITARCASVHSFDIFLISLPNGELLSEGKRHYCGFGIASNNLKDCDTNNVENFKKSLLAKGFKVR